MMTEEYVREGAVQPIPTALDDLDKGLAHLVDVLSDLQGRLSGVLRPAHLSGATPTDDVPMAPLVAPLTERILAANIRLRAATDIARLIVDSLEL